MSVSDSDDLGYTVPQKPSDLAALTDDELFALVRKVAFANVWQVSAKVELEATARLIASLKAFRTSSERNGNILIALTIVLVILTGVLVWLTLRLK